MKKTNTIIFCAMVLLYSGKIAAQNFFDSTVKFIGALDSDPSKDWTAGWTNFNPKATSYAAHTDSVTLNGAASGKLEISSSLTLDANKVYLLTGFVIVKSGATLTIPAGTLIRGRADLNATPKNYATLIVERGGKLIVNGTKAKPVVFTSWKTTGRDRGDWGGIVLTGTAVNNQGNDVQLEGFNNVVFDGNLGKYGGSNDDDSSGSIQYCRIEFAGLAFEPNREINSLTLGSIGRKTVLDYIQTSYGNDDAFEFFGGTVNAKHLISFVTTDDDFDLDFGYSGAIQFGIAVKDTNYYDLSWNVSGGSTSETFEIDNDAGGSGKRPLTSAYLSNFTVVGPVPVGKTWASMGSTPRGAFRRGARIRRNSRVAIVNSIIMGYRNQVMIDGDSCNLFAGYKDSSDKRNVTMSPGVFNSFIGGVSVAGGRSRAVNGLLEVAGSAGDTAGYLRRGSGLLRAYNKVDVLSYTAGSILVDPQNATAPNFRPVNNMNLTTGAVFNYAGFNKYGFIKKAQNNNGLSSKNTLRFVAYPNPAKDKIYIQGAEKNATYNLYSKEGKLLASGTVGSAIHISGITTGVYYLQVVNDKQLSGTQVISIQ